MPLVVSYGLSEATCTSTMNPPAARRIGSVGTVLPGQQVSLLRPGSGEAVPDGAEGEVCIAGGSVMKGYVDGSTAAALRDGWLRSGDLGRFDADGYLFITGRLKDVIVRGGENLSPRAIESTLERHPAVESCCVVGGPHPDLGEVPVAFVQPRAGGDGGGGDGGGCGSRPANSAPSSPPGCRGPTPRHASTSSTRCPRTPWARWTAPRSRAGPATAAPVYNRIIA